MTKNEKSRLLRAAYMRRDEARTEWERAKRSHERGASKRPYDDLVEVEREIDELTRRK